MPENYCGDTSSNFRNSPGSEMTPSLAVLDIKDGAEGAAHGKNDESHMDLVPDMSYSLPHVIG